jgi:CHAT domain-containing protein/tetratricopeptide (TPR) repeat protein
VLGGRCVIVAALALALVTTPAAAARRVDEAVRLEQRAAELQHEGRDAAADSLWQRAFELRSAQAPREDDAIALAGLADVRRRLRRWADADSLSRLGLERLAGARQPDPAIASRLHEVRANLFAERRDPGRALAEIDSALALQRAIQPADSAGLARQISVRGRVLHIAGRLSEAIAHQQEAAGIQERRLGPAHRDLGETMYRLCMAASEQGDYVLGLRAAERSVAVREQAFGPDHLLVAVSSMGLGGARRDLGDNDGALAAYERAERILRALDPPNPAALATTLSNKGSVYLILGDGTRARACYEETIALRDGVYGPGRGEDLFVAGRMAMALLLEGDAAAARQRVERALARSPRVDPLVTPGTLAIHASAASRLGDLAAARASLERSHALSDSLRGPGSPRTLETLGQLAALDLAEGRREDAFRRAVQIEERGRSYLAHAAGLLSEREALEWAAIRETGLTVLVALASDSIGLDPARRRSVLEAVIRSRVLVLDRLAEERRDTIGGDPAIAPLARELAEARADLARLLVAEAYDEAVDPAVTAAARRRREQAERALGAASATYRGAHARIEGGMTAVAAGLRPGWALVSFVRMPPPAIELVDATARDPAAARYAAFVLRAGEEAPRVIALGTAGRLEPPIERWIAALSARPAPATAAAAERRAAALGLAVRRAVWDPLARALAGVDTIAWVPDGALHRMDPGALPGQVAGRYLADQPGLLVRLTAERDLIADPDAAQRGRGLLAMGSVDFDAEPASAASALIADATSTRDQRRGRFQPLPATAREVESIARTWRASAAGEPAMVYVGAEAREDVLKREAPGARVLHLATHAFALGSDAPSTGEAVGANVRGVGGVAAADSTASGPSPRSARAVPGLALAGANRRGAFGGDDGFLTAEEISGLDLRRVEWAVLSACATAGADPTAAEAVQGLHRALRRAGVGTVILSLWAVDDAATAAWMDALYTARLARGLATAPAVRAAQRSVLAARRRAQESTHPFFWAAFIATGRAR